MRDRMEIEERLDREEASYVVYETEFDEGYDYGYDDAELDVLAWVLECSFETQKSKIW